ncbi:hypothetical protein [Neobacillus sp. PS2-9]|uniref:hypothetical protein n=1 Tax=Neobacillus sp. PS2-9 TaxID=3070676 RepID=UPI0027E0CBDE|nr:hypothetical protein [Neobacillus sp. PS2-9]WML56317.1 hypothetical protein RCG25_15400 [Neobacillus sp. PS2-9]
MFSENYVNVGKKQLLNYQLRICLLALLLYNQSRNICSRKMRESLFQSLNDIQINVLIASIIGDGELTKLYKGSRRKNSSYREHYGVKQKEYREWKMEIMNGLFYITPKSNSLRSASSPLFTNLLELFYNNNENKKIPSSILPFCNLPHFLAVLYMDDGSLSISTNINHNNKKFILHPISIYIYRTTP